MATPTSDYDYRGVAIAPLESYIGLMDKFEQAVDGDKGKHVYLHYPEGLLKSDPRVEGADPNEAPDMQVMELTKFVRLALHNNPSVMETLFTDESEVVIRNSIMRPLLDNRHKMLSKQSRARFCGYAVSQLNRIKRHKRWLDNPPTHKPTREEFGLPEQSLISQDQIGAANALIQKEIDEFMVDQTHLPEDVKIELSASLGKSMRAVWTALHTDVPYPVGEGQKFETTEDALYWGAAKDQKFSDNFLEVLVKEKQYRTAKREWDQYQTWLRQRNEARAELEKQFGFDCYLDDTEFLTNEGWKRYDEITDEHKLGTLNTSGRLEFQHFTERVEKSYTGPIAYLHPRHSNCAVTLNHRMWVSPVHRSQANGFSTAYTESGAGWGIKPMQEILDERKSWFHVRVACTPNQDLYPVSDDKLILMGCYVTEGSVAKRLKDGTASVLRLSQKAGGSQEKFANNLHQAYPDVVRKFSHLHDEESRSEPCQENIWTIANREWAQQIEGWCGSGSENKRLPPWTLELSAQQVDLLLDVIVAGDGTERPYSRVYYTSSKQLADDIQAMCVATGIISQVWGPYPNGDNLPMYQVYIGRRQEVIPAAFRDGANIDIKEVSGARIVCFTVPNEILITRRKGNVAIQGNTKHASHLVRLLRMAREILTEGVVRVKRPDAEELLAIRRGAWSYEQIIEFAEQEDKELNETSKTCQLPKVPDMRFFDNLVRDMVLEFNGLRLR